MGGVASVFCRGLALSGRDTSANPRLCNDSPLRLRGNGMGCPPSAADITSRNGVRRHGRQNPEVERKPLRDNINR